MERGLPLSINEKQKATMRGTYTTLLTSCTLNQHLYETEQEAKQQVELTTPIFEG